MNGKTAVFTIASENYFAQVQTLLDSLQKTNPTWNRFFAVVDEPDNDLIEALKITNTKLINMDQIGIPDLNDMRFRYDIMELNTAIKPFVFLTLLKDYDRVVYLDPDICVYEEMTEVNDAFDKGYHFVIIPHFNDYFDDDNLHPDEPDIMRAGIYNFGFFAANNSEDAIKAISWWAKRLEKQCINQQTKGIFVDQKWMDLLPGRHDKIFIIRHSGYNTAYWNLSHRKATLINGKIHFNGEPLVFFHFSGFNPQKRTEISKHQNRYQMKDIGVADSLFYAYADAALNNGYDSWRKKKYSYNKFTDGREIKDIFRILYRENKAIEDEIKRKNPFQCAGYFYDNKKKLAPILINHVIHTHNGIAEYFINQDRNTWLQWFGNVLTDEYKLDDEWIRFATDFFLRHLSVFESQKIELKSYQPPKKTKKDGVNLVGYIKSEHGVGEACRLTADAINSTDIDWNAYDWEINNFAIQTNDTWNGKLTDQFIYNISVFNINADQLPIAREHLPADAWNGYNIGIWFWELTKFPKQWRNAFNLVDEIWAPTKFIQENLQKVSPVPVLYMPPGLRREEPKPEFNRTYFGLPENTFLFLNFFDAFSYTSRKNPYAAIKAFQLAYQPDDMSVGIILKVNNASEEGESVISLKKAIADYKNIYIIAKTMTRDEINGLINICDASVSLHRSEGLGLLCQESMYFGKPVIATNWSGNTDFMTEDNACLVDYKLIPIGEYYGTNDPDQKWADADVTHAASYMKRLSSDHDYYNKIALNAKSYIRTKFSPEVCGRRMADRISDILERKDEWRDSKATAAIDTPIIGNRSQHEIDISTANTFCQIQYNRDLGNNPIKVFIKKCIRKSLRWLIAPIVAEQTKYNAAIVRLVNELLSEFNSLEKRSGLTEEELRTFSVQANTVHSEITNIKSELQNSCKIQDINTELQKLWKVQNINAELQQLHKVQDANSDMAEHYYQASASLYNAMYQRVTSIDKTLDGKVNNGSKHIKKEFIENKWKLIDKYFVEPSTMICCICDKTVDTNSSEKFISEDIYGGGKLVRYRCPHCGAIIGPNKMWELSEEELSDEYKYHYEVNDEGQTTDAEIECFMDMKPQKGKCYLNYGCGAWASTINKLREQGYDVYGFDPYAPCDSEYIITDFEKLKKKKFDGIFSHDLLEHLRYPVETFELMKYILNDDGIMAHSTACYKYVYEYDRFHLVFYTGNAVSELCRRTGFVLAEKHEDIDKLKFNYIYKQV